VGNLVVAIRNPLEPAGDDHPLNAPALNSPIETILGHEFSRPELLREAMTHRSAVYGRGRPLALLVSQPVLATVADGIGLGDTLSVAPGEARAGVRRRATVLADALEAALGALYLDGGIDRARAFVRRAWDGAMNRQEAPPRDAKTTLQEWVQARSLGLPEYVVASRAGPPHSPEFVVTVAVSGFSGTGTAGSKRAAEQLAAQDLLRVLGA
jgi:ribonuclease-3